MTLLEAAFIEGESAPEGGGALRALHEQFMSEQRFNARLAPATLHVYRQAFATLMDILPTLTPERLTPAAMTEFFRRLELRTRRVGNQERRGVKSSTVAAYRAKLAKFFLWLQARGVITEFPFRGMPYPRVEYEDRKFLGRVAVERIFAALTLGARWRSRRLRTRNLALFATLLYTGLRRGELLGLHVSDVDLRRLEITVRPETSKSRLRRIVPISSRLLSALEDHLAERGKGELGSEYLFTNSTGERPLTREGLNHLVERVKAASGVRFHLHQFRHTFAVNFLNRGGDVAKLKQLLGHRDIRMTSVYLRSLPSTAMRNDIEGITLDALL